MADEVVIYWVPFNGKTYAASLVSRTFIPLSGSERLAAAKRALDFAGIPHKDWPHGSPNSMEEFGVEIGPGSPQAVLLQTLVQTVENIPRYKIAISTDTEAWYAHCPGVFFHITSMDYYNWLRMCGLIQDSSKALRVNDDLINLIRQESQRKFGEVGDLYKPPTDAYTVQKGDTFTRIANSLKVSVDALKAANPKVTNVDNISEGDVLNVPKA